MKILFGIQATGNGHLSRSIELYEMLKANPAVSQIDVLVSGVSEKPKGLPFEVKYNYRGFSFSYGKSGNISFWKTLPKANFASFFWGIITTPFRQYDLIISDYEPISVWGAKLRGIESVGLGNMFSMTSKHFPNPHYSGKLSRLLTKILCPVDHKVANHYLKFDDFIFAPVIRREIRNALPTDADFTLVYLTSYSEEQLVAFFSQELFIAKRFVIYAQTPISYNPTPNVTVKPLGNREFTIDIIQCSSVITAGGFQTTAEALYLGKKLLCIPLRKQFEQVSNAKALESMGVRVLPDLDATAISQWLHTAVAVQIKFEDEMPAMVSRILAAA